MNREFIWIGIIVLLVFGSGFFISITDSENLNLNNVYKTCIMEKKVLDKNVNELQYKIMVLQENEKYSNTELRKARNERNELQIVYDKLWLDTTSCYWANACLYYPEDCVAYFDEPGWTAKDLHLYYSNECDMLIRDWSLYAENDGGTND